MSTPETNAIVEPGTAMTWDGKFRDADEALTDPDRVGFAVIGPNAQQVNFVFGANSEVTRIGTGHYRFTYVPTAKGKYEMQAAASGAVAVTGRVTFQVAETRFTEDWINAE